ncbi:MAG: penicillin-binding protein 2 [Holosporaceae bacterium]|jgi:cell division protein FtsI (penicillin-binding protein 3)|nr:penicillin-binding protein 2 [Holosporaceae bacterium]
MHKGYGNNIYSLSRSLKIAKQRTLFAISIFLLLFSLLIVRMAQIMIFNNRDGEVGFDYAPLVISRADITDRNGVIVATSLPTTSLYACPHEMMDVKEAAEKISIALKDLDKADIAKKLSSGKKFLWIKRNLSPMQEQAVLNQGIPGMHFLKTERRVYPDGSLLGHVIGGTDVDNIGIAGMEKVFDTSLRESSEPIALSVDVKIQYAVRDELQKGVEEFRAIAGSAVVMKIATGEIIALASLPDFDPNKNSDPKAKERFNMITSSAIEPGSSAKIFNTAMALESGRVTPFTTFDARFPLNIGKFTVHDFKGQGRFLSVEEILKFSSNIGSARIAMAVGREVQKKFFKEVGLLDAVSCELPETQRPLYPAQWTDISSVTISYGHGIALSPLHMITVVSGIINDGILNNPTLLKQESSMQGKGRRIVSPKTSNLMRALMRINVTEGSNRYANVPGYFVGGKSGTAEKQKRGRYLKTSNYTAFIGAFPMTNPKYCVYVVLDEPQATAKTHGYRTGGWNAAPICARIIKRIATMLGVIASSDPEPDWKAIMGKIK